MFDTCYCGFIIRPEALHGMRACMHRDPGPPLISAASIICPHCEDLLRLQEDLDLKPDEFRIVRGLDDPETIAKPKKIHEAIAKMKSGNPRDSTVVMRRVNSEKCIGSVEIIKLFDAIKLEKRPLWKRGLLKTILG